MLASKRVSQPDLTGQRLTSNTFEQFAGVAAILAGAAGFLYAVAFLVVARSQPELGALLSALFLLLLGVLATAPLTALYERLRETDPTAALWGLLLGVAGALGAAVHGGYDLANAINPVPAATTLADLPSPVDPRGLLAFGLAGLGLLVVSTLILRDARFPRGLGYLGCASAILLVVLYLGRLIVLAPTSPIILAPAMVNGFIVNPLWYIWLGVVFTRGK